MDIRNIRNSSNKKCICVFSCWWAIIYEWEKLHWHLHHFIKIIIMVLLWKFKTIFQMSKPNYRSPNYNAYEQTCERYEPGGNLLFSISIATTFTMSTHIGQSNISISDFTNATSERHCVSNLRRSGYARLNSRFTFDWNFFISNNCQIERNFLLI